jgi:hypothetical protein
VFEHVRRKHEIIGVGRQTLHVGRFNDMLLASRLSGIKPVGISLTDRAFPYSGASKVAVVEFLDQRIDREYSPSGKDLTGATDLDSAFANELILECQE